MTVGSAATPAYKLDVQGTFRCTGTAATGALTCSTIVTSSTITANGALTGTTATFSGNCTLGDSTSADSHTINGSLRVKPTSIGYVDIVGNGSYACRIKNPNGNLHIGAGSIYLEYGPSNVQVMVAECATGNIGIGNAATTTPSTKLTVQDNGGTALAKIYQTAGTTTTGIDVLEVRCDDTSNAGAYNLITANRSGTDIFVVQGDGNVGIGLTDPGRPLDVKSSAIATTGGIQLQASGDVNRVVRLYEVTAGDGAIDLCKNDVGTTVLLQADGNSYFTGGKVGIGTAAPDHILELSANSSTELNTIINKTLAYEKATFIEITGTDWYESSALVGDPSSTGQSAIITNEYIENILNAYDFDDVQLCAGCGNYSNWMQNKLEEGVKMLLID